MIATVPKHMLTSHLVWQYQLEGGSDVCVFRVGESDRYTVTLFYEKRQYAGWRQSGLPAAKARAARLAIWLEARTFGDRTIKAKA
jgi:hypothetical protein